jgi:hypothetical protein
MKSGITMTNNAAKGLRARAVAMKRDVPVLLRRAGRLCAVSLAIQTQPFSGVGKDGRKLGEQATAGDIRRCYATPGDVYAAFGDKRYANAFYAKLMSGQIAHAQAIVDSQCPAFRGIPIGHFDLFLHQGRRNSRGRINKKMRPLQIVILTKPLFDYIKAEVKLVGFGKAGWATCARILGGIRGIDAQWVTRHKAPGSVGESNNGKTLTLTNQVSYATWILTESQKRNAVRIATEKLVESIMIAQQYEARKAGF